MGYPTFNAKADTVDTLSSFRAPWRENKRCLVVTTGFYEWKKGHTNPKLKQPYAITLKSSELMVMAGLWESRRGKDARRMLDGKGRPTMLRERQQMTEIDL